MTVTVIHAAAGLEMESEELMVPPGTTLKAALDGSRLAQRVNPFNDKRVGIFGQLCLPEQVLEAGDRIEIYQPLKVDPKEARRRRAEVRGKQRR
jgi:putative ubiquitin-RnfH superfamily antitoxin RatB of RatAB toxin-antitoxin module